MGRDISYYGVSEPTGGEEKVHEVFDDSASQQLPFFVSRWNVVLTDVLYDTREQAKLWTTAELKNLISEWVQLESLDHDTAEALLVVTFVLNDMLDSGWSKVKITYA